MDHPFRSAALGGFNKQDVLSFLEEQARQAAQTQEELHSQLEETGRRADALQREADALRQELAETRRELESTRQVRDSLSAQLEQASVDLSASRTQASQLSRQLEQASLERDEVQARLDAALPDARTYAQIKERTAGVELEAHRRAQAIQEKAEGDARHTRRQAEQWLQRLGREFDALRSQVESTVSHAASELEKAETCLEQVSRMLGSQESALDSLSRAYDATDPARVEAPMPLPEE